MHRVSLSLVIASAGSLALVACNRADTSSMFASDAQAASLPAVVAEPVAAAAIAAPVVNPPPANETLAPMPSLAPLVKRLRPVVVNINSKFRPRPQPVARRSLNQRAPAPEGPGGDDEQDDQNGDEPQDPMHRFFKYFGGHGGQQPQDTEPRSGLGSGFLIGNGLVITNNHVVQISEAGKYRPMDEIKIITDDSAEGGAREYPARVLGADPKSDIALLKIDDPRAQGLVGAQLGDSDALEVGDYVVAIGEPFGLQATVTAGIISAKERSQAGGLNGAYSDYLQTDASINPGNSGGPLFNLRGEVVGVNSAIISGANTIGFAIPIAVVKQILPQLKDKGRVSRGFLGVSLQPLTQDTAEQLGLKSTQGALVADVIKDGGADKAGIHAGDVIIKINGQGVADNNVLMRAVGSIPPGKQIKLLAIRDGKEKTFDVELAKRPDEVDDVKADPGSSTAPVSDPLGLVVEPLTPELARRVHVDSATKGVVITDVDQDSPVLGEGVQPGDVVLEVNRVPIASVGDYKKAAKAIKAGTTVLMRVRRGTQAEYLTIHLPH